MVNDRDSPAIRSPIPGQRHVLLDTTPEPAFSGDQGDRGAGRRAVREEMERARQTFHRLLDRATVADLRRPSSGTRWNNEQLRFHMLFGYLIVRALLVLGRIFSRLPDGARRAFTRLLDAARTLFDVINYAGSCLGARIIPCSRMGRASLTG